VAHYRECVVEGACREPHSGSAAYRIEAEAYYLNWGQPGRDAHPVNGVSWYDANNFCLWASKRLPTEAEWEWSARGDDGRRYPWGNEEATCKRAIIDDGGDGCGHEMAWPVGSRVSGASPFGVLDQAGNLWEWMADWYDRQYYHRSAVHNPHNEEEGEGLKVLRGGSMADQNPHVHRLTNRLGYDPRQRFDYTVGFRCARDLPQ
jgi:formylglycine-generating enzyme required for sulfatase activity